MLTKVAIVLSLIFLAAPITPGISQAQTAGPETEVDRIFERWNRSDSPGCAVGVAREGQTVYARGFGMASLEHGVPISLSTIFYTGSLSKQFTAAALVRAAQQGKLTLDDDVRRWVPEVPDFGVRITLRHLLHHTSGLREQLDLLELAGWRPAEDMITEDDLMAQVSRQRELNFRPGTEYAYSNMGYTLLAVALRRATGHSLREFTTAQIFRPLSMNSTFFLDDHTEVVKNFAFSYRNPAAGQFRVSYPKSDTVGPSGLVTTVGDLLRWDQNFYQPQVGGQAMIDQLHERPALTDVDPTRPASFGLRLYTYRGLRVEGFGGAEGAFRSALWRFPDQRFSVIVLCNVGTANQGQLVQRVADVYLQSAFKTPAAAPTSTMPPSETKTAELGASPRPLGDYAGSYLCEEIDAIFRFAVDGNKLVLRQPKSPPSTLKPKAPDVFTDEWGTDIAFVRGGNRAVTGFVMHLGPRSPSAGPQRISFAKVQIR